MFGLEGNKDPEQPEKVRNTRHFLVLDDRKFGRTAKIPLFYDVDTGVFDEPPEGFLEDDHAQRLSEWVSVEPQGNFTTDKDPVNVDVEDFDREVNTGIVEDFIEETFDEEDLPFD